MWSRETVLDVEHASSGGLARMMGAARAVPKKASASVGTYSRKVITMPTNPCRNERGYCTVAMQPGAPGGGYTTPHGVTQTLLRAERYGRASNDVCRMIGGARPHQDRGWTFSGRQNGKKLGPQKRPARHFHLRCHVESSKQAEEASA